MADISYNIEANLKLAGAGTFADGMGKSAKATDGLKTALGGVMQMAGGFTDLAARAVAMAGGLASASASAGIAIGAKMVSAVGANLSMLEDKGIQLATVIGAAAEVPFDHARHASKDLFDQFRQDAIKSAGETADFVNVASMLTGPILGAGKGMSELHDITKNVVAAAPGIGVSFEQAGSDVMRMLQGVAGVEQPLFRAMVAIPSLGIKKAEEFNKLSVEQRYQKVAKALSNPAFKAAADAAGDSWTGLLSTAQDITKTVGGLVGGPLYELAKTSLKGLTGGFIGPGGLLDDKAFKTKLGLLGAEAELTVRRMAKQFGRIFPEFNTGANSALDIVTNLATSGMNKLVEGSKWIADHWGEIKQFARDTVDFVTEAAKKAEEFIKAFGGGDFATGAKRLAEAFAVKKGVEAASPVLSGGAQVVQGLSGAMGGSTMAGTSLLAASGQLALAAGAILAAGYGLSEGVKSFNAWEVKTGRRFKETEGELTPTDKATGQKLNAMPGAEALGSLQVPGLGVDFAHQLKGGMPGELALPGGASSAPGQEQPQSVGVLPTASGMPGALTAEGLTGISPETPVQRLVDMYNDAIVANDDGAARFSAEMLVQSGKTAADLTKLGLSVAGGLDKFGDMLKGSSEEMLQKLAAFIANPKGPEIGGKKQPSSASGHGGMTVTIKWDLGEGNEEAIYVRTRKDVVDMTKRATGQVRGGKLPGWF